VPNLTPSGDPHKRFSTGRAKQFPARWPGPWNPARSGGFPRARAGLTLCQPTAYR